MLKMMATDADDGKTGDEPRHADLVRGAALVALSERFSQGVFVGALCFVGIATLTAAAFLPLRDSAVNGQPPLSAVIASVTVIAFVGFALRYVGAVYRMLRVHPRLELLPVLLSALLLSVASPLRNELWWPACAILMLLATQAPARRALAYCLLVLLANLAAHVLSGSIDEISTVGIVGLWIGLPFWTAMAAIIPERLESFILRLNTTRAIPPAPPRRVHAWTTEGPTHERSPRDDVGAHAAQLAVRSDVAGSPGATGVTTRLTARQLEVVVLLADGLRYRDVAQCLSISPGQVHRHVANAVTRASVHSINELVAIAVAEGVLPAGEMSPSGSGLAGSAPTSKPLRVAEDAAVPSVLDLEFRPLPAVDPPATGCSGAWPPAGGDRRARP